MKSTSDAEDAVQDAFLKYIQKRPNFENDSDGKVVYADSYSGFKGVFPLELDKSKADPKSAEKLIG